jgi:hypothetical protein
MVQYGQLTAELARAVPELRIPVESEKRWWKGETPPQHVVFGNLLSAFLVEELQRGGRPEVLARAFAFLEEMAGSPDVLVREVAQQSVLSELCGDQEWSDTLAKLLGSESKRLMLEYCDAYHLDH